MTTQVFDLTDAWQEIATGPCLIEDNASKTGSAVLLHFGDTAPAADSSAWHLLGNQHGRSFPYGGSHKCYARASVGQAKVVVTSST